MKLLLILSSFYLATIQAAEYTSVSPIHFEIKRESINEKFQRTMQNPEQLLRRFRPEGAVISQKQVLGSSISFIATKTVLFISKSVSVHGQLDVQEKNQGCSSGSVGYNIVLNLDGSDSLVTDNVDHLEAKLCVKTFNDQHLVGDVQAKIFKGSHFSRTLGPIAISMIEAQVAPLIRALNEEIKQMK